MKRNATGQDGQEENAQNKKSKPISSQNIDETWHIREKIKEKVITADAVSLIDTMKILYVHRVYPKSTMYLIYNSL